MSLRRPPWFRPVLLFIAVGALVGASLIAIGSASASDDSVLIAVVGDIQCGAESPTGKGRCQSSEVRALIDAHAPDLVLMPGDLQYETGSVSDFASAFGPTWGDIASILRPAPGNHEYRDQVAGYRGFFGDTVMTNGQLFYGLAQAPGRDSPSIQIAVTLTAAPPGRNTSGLRGSWGRGAP